MEESFVDPTQPPPHTLASQGQLDPNFTADITRRMQVPILNLFIFIWMDF